MDNLSRIRRSNLLRVIYLGVCFMFLFTAYLAAQNLMTQIYRQLGYGNLGQICFFTVYSALALASFVSTHYLKKMNAKSGLFGSAMTYVGLILAGTLATYCDKYQSDSAICNTSFIFSLNIITAALLGFGGNFLWNCQAVYVNACADEKSRGAFNGIFLALMQTSQILSGFVATFVLGYADQFTFYSILLIFGIISVVMFLFIQSPIEYETKEKEISVIPEMTLNESVKSFVSTFGEKRYFFLFTAMAFSGVAVSCYAIYLGTAVSSIVDSDNVNIINQKTGLVFIVLAIAEVAAGLTIGRLADKYDKMNLLALTLFINEAALVLTLLAVFLKSFSMIIVAGALWGYGDTACNTMLNVVIGSKFNANPKLFSCMRFFQSAGCVFTAICGIIISSPILFIMIVAACLLILQSLFYRSLPFYSEKAQSYARLEAELMIEMKNI
jgi:MFS family permease